MNSFTFLIVCFSWLFLVLGTQQSQNSPILLQLRKQLEYPKPLEPWNNYNGSLCNLISSSQVTVKCEGNFVTELKILGEIPSKVTSFNGFAIPNLTLSGRFSIDSFVTTLTKLSNLRVLSLVSLGIWGSLPDKIHRLQMLEFLDLSSNFLYSSIPPKIASMAKLQTLTLDENFLNNTISDWFDSLSNLTILSLKNNQLKGHFPSSICRIKTLTKIALSHNEISGKLPDCLSDLTNLHVLDLGENQIYSELPVMPRQLITVLLENNSLSGEIPLQFGELSQLQHLDLSFNFLQGTLHASLFSLRLLNYLNLASNMLAGSLPERLTCSRALEFVDISTNRLTGKLPSCLSSMTDKRVVKFDMNCLSTDPLHQHGGSFCKENHIKGKKSVWVQMGFIGGFLIIIGLLAFGFLVFLRRYCSRRASRHRRLPKAVQDYSSTRFSSEILANARFISQTAMLGSQGVPLCRIFYIEELKEATNNFDQSALMGNGSIGKLYKGKLENRTSVAIRCLALVKRLSIRNLKLRLDLLSKLRHPHLVCLLGYCIESDERDDSSVKRIFVIYEYMPNGNLHTHVSECSPEKALRWSERLSVLIGIAKAVHFLHTGMNPGFFNNYLKTKSILLDEHGIAKLSDYGLSVITEEIDKFKAKRENSNSHSTMKGDVYSFGFILLETLLGSATTERGEAVLLNEMATTFDSRNGRRQIIDPTVLATCCEESLSIVISITNKCISRDLSTRPSFEDVLWNLQYAAQVQDDGDQTLSH